MKRFILKIIALTICITTLFSFTSYAQEYGYIFEDGSSDIWGDVNTINISSEYALAVIDFDSFIEEKKSTYLIVDIDLETIDISEIYIENGTLRETSIENVYLIELNTSAETYTELYSLEINAGDILYSETSEITVDSYSDGLITFTEEVSEASLPIYDADGNLVAVTASPITAYSAEYLNTQIFTTEEETTQETTQETTAETEAETEADLDFSALEEAITKAKEIDTSLYSDTSEFDIAYTNAKTVYLNAETQIEIDEATEILLSAIEALDLKSASTIPLIIFIFIVVIFFGFIIYFFFFKKNGNKKENKEKKKNESEQNVSDKDYGDEYNLYNDIDEEDAPTTFLNTSKVYLLRRSTGEKIRISNTTFNIGRGNADYKIKGNPAIGRLHCCIYMQGDDYYIEDMHSTNGTFVNGNKIDGRCRLEDRDTIKLADEEFNFYTR